MMEHLGGPETPEKIASRHARYLADTVSGLFRVDSDGEPAGWVGYWTRDWREQQVYEVGWSVLPELQRRGIADAGHITGDRARPPRRPAPLHARLPIGGQRGVERDLPQARLRPAGRPEFEYPKGRLMRCNDWRLEPTPRRAATLAALLSAARTEEAKDAGSTAYVSTPRGEDAGIRRSAERSGGR